MDDNQTRDRIRALVRDVLDKALPDEREAAALAQRDTSSRFIDTAPKSPVTTARRHRDA